MKPSGYLVVAHAHPAFSKGGGELAAYNLFKGLREAAPGKPCRFMAVVGFEVPAGSITRYRESEYLLGAIVQDYHLQSGPAVALDESLEGFAADFSPEFISFHHYFHVGLETIVLMRRRFPQAKMVLTLHEFLAICRSDGQFVKRDTHSLCHAADAFACNRCFPKLPVAAFEERKQTFQSVFSLFDAFVSPSAFLRQRYVDWGLPADRVFLVENGQDLAPVDEATGAVGRRLRAQRSARRLPNRFGFFGQITSYKGLDVILSAARQLVASGFTDFQIEVNGANLDNQLPELRALIDAILVPLVTSGHVVWNGPYDRLEFAGRIGRVDWVVVPSIWWENSPMVIQEAYHFGKPVICSGIGGMAEKVVDGVTGYHVPVGSATDWAETIRAVSSDAATYDQLCSNLPAPIGIAEMARGYLNLSKGAPPLVALMKKTTVPIIGTAATKTTPPMDKPTAILWNKPALAPKFHNANPTEVYNGTGHNTGNMAYVEGLRVLLGDDVPTYGWMSNVDFINENCSRVIFPAANQLGAHTDLGDLAEQFDKIKVPICVIGLGAQARSVDDPLELKPGTRRWLDVLMDHAPSAKVPSVVVRGQFTGEILEKLGYGGRYLVGGCPSQFLSPEPSLGAVLAERRGYDTLQRLAIASSHYSWAGWVREIEKELVAYMESSGGSYVVQAPAIMIRSGLGDKTLLVDPEFEKVRKFLRPDLATNAFFEWCRRNVYAFGGAYPWMHWLSRHDFVVGTRSHGVTLGLQAGIPGYLIAFDTRTKELAEAMGFPHGRPGDIQGSVVEHAKKAIAAFDFSQLDAKRRSNARLYAEFFRSNGIVYKNAVLEKILKG